MKKLLMGLGLVALLAGCASRDNDNGMGGTGDSMKTDSINNTTSGQYNNNATSGTGAATATNSATGQSNNP